MSFNLDKILGMLDGSFHELPPFPTQKSFTFGAALAGRIDHKLLNPEATANGEVLSILKEAGEV